MNVLVEPGGNGWHYKTSNIFAKQEEKSIPLLLNKYTI